jgi:hypothetical protein
MRIVDPARYRSLVHVLGGVLGVLVVIDLALRLALGILPAALLRTSFHDPSNHERVAGRVSAVIAEGEHANPIAVIIGSSSAQDGFMAAELGAADPAHRRWLNLATTGSSFDELRYTFGPLFASELDADLLVIAIHPGWLAGRVVDDPAFDAILISSTAPRTSWLLFNRGRVNQLARSALGDLREWLLLGKLGVPFDGVHPPTLEPWRDSPRNDGVWEAAFARHQLETWQRKRWFEASWFARADEEVDAAAEVVAAAQRTAKRVVVVLMPESSTLRAAMPVEAEAAFRRALARLAAPPPVLDLRAAIPDELFKDHIHLGGRGAQLLSTLMPDRIAELARR